MKGEFRGDVSRDTFDPGNHFLRVVMQQGRVQLDADWNEQMDILLHYIQTLAKDIIGPYSGPEDYLGFSINIPDKEIIKIGRGRYYVDGILCENDGIVDYFEQLDYPLDEKESPLPKDSDDFPFLVYLDVWERHISYVENDYIREKALGDADTCNRSKVVWHVKTLQQKDWSSNFADKNMTCRNVRDGWADLVRWCLQGPNRGQLKARAQKPKDVSEPCITSPEARYRGAENQLYRVEIHKGGSARVNQDVQVKARVPAATFKWSRDNGSVVYPISRKKGKEVMLMHLGRDDMLRLKVGDRVEVVDDKYTLLVQSIPRKLRALAKVQEVDLMNMKVTLDIEAGPDYDEEEVDEVDKKHPLLRRWDHKEGYPNRKEDPEMADDGSLFIEEGGWLNLEDGVQIYFEPPKADGLQNVYRTGDYWLLPARTATGDVEWPGPVDDPLPKPPHGINHHYAPLAVISLKDTNWKSEDCRCAIKVECNKPT